MLPPTSVDQQGMGPTARSRPVACHDGRAAERAVMARAER
jgi:hypothetical protein